MDQEDVYGGKLTDLPNDKYVKFFEKFKEIESLNPRDWKPAHVLGYFCKKYQEYYNTPYKFKFNNPAPSKCFEVFQIKKLSYSLTSQPHLLQKYIDWIFENKVVKAKRKLTSISFLTNEESMKEYKMNVLFNTNDKITRTTELPDTHKKIFESVGYNITTYGDLAFIAQMSDMNDQVKNALQEVLVLEDNKDILTRIV